MVDTCRSETVGEMSGEKGRGIGATREVLGHPRSTVSSPRSLHLGQVFPHPSTTAGLEITGGNSYCCPLPQSIDRAAETPMLITSKQGDLAARVDVVNA